MIESKHSLINRLVEVCQGLLSSFDGEPQTLTKLEIELIEMWIPYLEIMPITINEDQPIARGKRSYDFHVKCLFANVFSIIGLEMFLLYTLCSWRLRDLADAYCQDLIQTTFYFNV